MMIPCHITSWKSFKLKLFYSYKKYLKVYYPDKERIIWKRHVHRIRSSLPRRNSSTTRGSILYECYITKTSVVKEWQHTLANKKLYTRVWIWKSHWNDCKPETNLTYATATGSIAKHVLVEDPKVAQEVWLKAQVRRAFCQKSP